MATPLTPHRHTERISSDREKLNHLLDTCQVATISSVIDGSPWALPTLVGRDGDTILVHGSTGAGLIRHVQHGAAAIVSAYAVDALVYSTQWLNHSMNYRSAVITGTFTTVTGAAKKAAMAAVLDTAVPGRSAETPAPSAKDEAATLVLALDITDDNWTFKQRSGGSSLPVVEGEPWQGIVPRKDTWGPAAPSAGQRDDAPRPSSFDHYNVP